MAISSDLDLFDEAAKEAGKSVITPTGGRKVNGVTAANYGQLAGVYLAERGGGEPFVIVGRYVTIKGEKKTPTVDQWAAWKGFFQSIGRQIIHMENVGYLTVPCEWPHEFSLEWSLENTASAIKTHRKDLHNTIAAQKAAEKPDPADEVANRALAERTKRDLPRIMAQMAAYDPVPVKQLPPIKTRTEED